jgi:hypothetical protein
VYHLGAAEQRCAQRNVLCLVEKPKGNLMKIKKNLIQLCLLCAAMLPAVVQAQLTFTTNNGAITITGYTGSSGTVVIPGATNGHPVVSIGPNAFNGCTNLTNVTIPNSVTNIGDYAFYQCTNLTNATLGNGVILHREARRSISVAA